MIILYCNCKYGFFLFVAQLRMATSDKCHHHLLMIFLSLFLLALPRSCASSEIKADLYPLYKKFEDALINNMHSLYELRDLFFFPNAPTVREVQLIRIEICVTAIVPSNSTAFKRIEDHNKTLIFHEYDFGCQIYKWSDSCLRTLVYVDILAILGPLYTGLIYNNMAGSIARKVPQIDFSLISLDRLPPDDYIRSATALLMIWVGFYYP